MIFKCILTGINITAGVLLAACAFLEKELNRKIKTAFYGVSAYLSVMAAALWV